MLDKPRLLVVDDERDVCEVLKIYFSRRNFQVDSAESVKDALATIKENKPDLIVLDMKLAGDLTGKDLLKTLRQYDKETKVIMVTGELLNELEVKEITNLGISDFLLKPVSAQGLESAIKKALQADKPDTLRFEAIKPKEESADVSLRDIVHDLSNVANSISSICELYVLDTEEGLNKDKTEKERLEEALNTVKSVLKSTQKLADLVNKLSSLAKKQL